MQARKLRCGRPRPSSRSRRARRPSRASSSASLSRPSFVAGPAHGRAADRAGRLRSAAQLLDRLGSREQRTTRARDRAAAGRGGIAVLPRCGQWSATRSSCAARSAATSCGRWRTAGRVLLVGGGSGVVPLAVHAASSRCAQAAPFRWRWSIRRARRGSDFRRRAATVACTRRWLPVHSDDHPRGESAGGFAPVASTQRCWPRAGAVTAPPKMVFVCGTNAFVETAADVLLGLGVAARVIRTERYGG